MDKLEKFLRSEMSARRLCELAEGEGLGLVPILQKCHRANRRIVLLAVRRLRFVHGIPPVEI